LFSRWRGAPHDRLPRQQPRGTAHTSSARQAAADQPDDAKARFNLATILKSRKAFDEALVEARAQDRVASALSVSPSSVVLRRAPPLPRYRLACAA
jgi:hypothetical protein